MTEKPFYQLNHGDVFTVTGDDGNETEYKKVSDRLAAHTSQPDDSVVDPFDPDTVVTLVDPVDPESLVPEGELSPEAGGTEGLGTDSDSVPTRTEIQQANKDTLNKWATAVGIDTDGKTAMELKQELIEHYHS